MLVIAICTLLCAGESFNDMADFGRAKADWLKTSLTLRNGIPGTTPSIAWSPRWTQSLGAAFKQEILALERNSMANRSAASKTAAKFAVIETVEGARSA